MGIFYNIENDAFYKQGRLEGKQQGRLEGKQQGRLEGRQQGRKEQRIAMILTLVKANKLTLEEISETFNISLKEVKNIVKKAKSK